MKPVSILALGVLGAAWLGLGVMLCVILSSMGLPVPLPGVIPGIVLAMLGGLVLWCGIQVKKYLDESRQRAHEHPLAPREHHVDALWAFRVIMVARAAAYTGAIAAGFFLGIAVYLWASGTGVIVEAILPTLWCAASSLALSIIGVVVERWGSVPPPSDGAEREAPGAEPALD